MRKLQIEWRSSSTINMPITYLLIDSTENIGTWHIITFPLVRGAFLSCQVLIVENIFKKNFDISYLFPVDWHVMWKHKETWNNNGNSFGISILKKVERDPLISLKLSKDNKQRFIILSVLLRFGLVSFSFCSNSSSPQSVHLMVWIGCFPEELI